jgi:hypothetical protein
MKNLQRLIWCKCSGSYTYNIQDVQKLSPIGLLYNMHTPHYILSESIVKELKNGAEKY